MQNSPICAINNSATSYQKEDNGFGHYRAQNYDELVDSPVEIGTFWHGRFSAGGVEHHFVVAGAPPRLTGNACWPIRKKSAQRKSASGTPRQPTTRNYMFMLNATARWLRRPGAPQQPRTDLQPAPTCPAKAWRSQPEGYTTLLGLISHEYFHTWNVKRLRPAALRPLQLQPRKLHRAAVVL